MYGSVEQAFVGRDEPKNGCEGGYPCMSIFSSPRCHMRCCSVKENFIHYFQLQLIGRLVAAHTEICHVFH